MMTNDIGANNQYQSRLTEHLGRYKREQLPGLPDGSWSHRGKQRSYAHVLPNESLELNILPGIRDRFWPWFRSHNPRLELHKDFHHLDSSQALSFNLFFPFLGEDGRHVDVRLLKALGIPGDETFAGHFERAFDKAENTHFDFYLEGVGGRKFFFELKLSEQAFDSCKDDQWHCDKLEEHYRPTLAEHIDHRWLENKTFFENYEILRNLSYLGRYPGSGMVFIFPKANEALAHAEETIKKIASRSLAPRVAILYLEYLVGRILTVTEDDADLHRHFMQLKEKYVVS